MKTPRLPTKLGYYLITPAMCELWLESGLGHQRSVSRHNVNTYGEDMVNKKWQVTGQPIIFDTNNNMIDGLHRCNSGKKSDASFVSLVVVDVEPESFAFIDTGKSRSPANLLQINGEKYATHLSSVCKIIYDYEHRNAPLSGHSRTPTHNILDVLERHPKLRESAYFVMSRGDKDLRTRHTIFMHYILKQALGEKGVDKFMSFSMGDNLGKTDPRLHLRNLMLANRGHVGNTDRIQPHVMFGSVCRTLDYIIEGRKCSASEMRYNARKQQFPRFDKKIMRYPKDIIEVARVKEKKVVEQKQLRLVG